MSTINIQEVLNSLSNACGDKIFRDAVNSWLGGPAPKKGKGKKTAKNDDGEKKTRSPTAWNAWIEERCGKKGSETSDFLSWKTEHADLKGNVRMIYAKHCKEVDAKAYESFAASFKPSTTGSNASVTTHETEAEAAAEVESEVVAAPAKKGKKAAAAKVVAAVSSEAEDEVVVEAKPAKKAAKPKATKKAPAKIVLSDSESDSD